MSNTYNISVTYEVITDESAELGDADDRGYEREREDVDLDELKKLISNYGFSQPSSSCLEDRMWFSTTSPLEDRDYFESGERKFFSLHLNSVNGEPPELADYADIARMAEIRIKGMEHAGTRIAADEDIELVDEREVSNYIEDSSPQQGGRSQSIAAFKLEKAHAEKNGLEILPSVNGPYAFDPATGTVVGVKGSEEYRKATSEAPTVAVDDDSPSPGM